MATFSLSHFTCAKGFSL